MAGILGTTRATAGILGQPDERPSIWDYLLNGTNGVHQQQALRQQQSTIAGILGQVGTPGGPAPSTDPGLDGDLGSLGIGAEPAKTSTMTPVQKALFAQALQKGDVTGANTIMNGNVDLAQGTDGSFYDKHSPAALGTRTANRVNINGTLVDLNNPQNDNQFFGEAPAKGAEPVYDGAGRRVGWHMLDGSIQAMQAASGAEAAGKLPYTPDNRTNGSGAPVYGMAADRLGGARPGAGGPAALVGISPADQAAATEQAQGAAKRDVDRTTGQPKAFSGLADQARTTDLVINSINNILPKVGAWTAGMGANLAALKGTPAHDVQAGLDTIRGNVGFDRLQQMRDSSPTGGALGQVSEQENHTLQSVLGSIDQGQSPDALRKSLTQVRDQLVAQRAQRSKLYNATYSGQAAPTTVGASAPRGGFGGSSREAVMAAAQARLKALGVQ